MIIKDFGIKIKKSWSKGFDNWLEEHSKLCQIPLLELNYYPYRSTFFSQYGEKLVNHLILIAPFAYSAFCELFDLSLQSRIAYEEFNKLKGSSADKPGKKGKSGYFKVIRNFLSLIPKMYSRSLNAPRITAKGSTFHGMAKALLMKIVKRLTEMNKRLFIAELDISAAHSRVANSLVKIKGALDDALNKENFWEINVSRFLPFYLEKDIKINPKQLKKILKCGLYTSLNGGNPASDDRLIDNLSTNASN